MYPIFNSKIDNNKPVLIVGNSPCVKEKELGKYINLENFNIIRFNLSKINGYEDYVGTGTTYRVINGVTWNSKRDMIPLENILIAELQHTPQYDILCKHPTNLDFQSVQILPNYCHKYLNTYPTSGMMAIAFFLQFYKSIYIHGFSFNDSHYYNNNVNKGAKHHSYKSERREVLKLNKLKKIIFLNLEDCLSLPKSIYNFEKKSTKTLSSNNTINVLSTNHVWNKSSNYFHFASNDINISMGDTIYLTGKLNRIGRYVNIVVWGYNNGGKRGDSHGKVFDEKMSLKKNDKIEVINILPIIRVLSTEHKFGPEYKGMYFHFNPENLKFENEQEYLCYIPKIKMKKKIIIWTKKNGGSSGKIHGRYVKGAKKYDFYKGDILVILSKI